MDGDFEYSGRSDACGLGGCGILEPGAFEWIVGSPASVKATCSDDRAACDKRWRMYSEWSVCGGEAGEDKSGDWIVRRRPSADSSKTCAWASCPDVAQKAERDTRADARMCCPACEGGGEEGITGITNGGGVVCVIGRGEDIIWKQQAQ